MKNYGMTENELITQLISVRRVQVSADIFKTKQKEHIDLWPAYWSLFCYLISLMYNVKVQTALWHRVYQS